MFCGRSYSIPCYPHNNTGLMLTTSSVATAASNSNCYFHVINVFEISEEITSFIINTHLRAPIYGGKTHLPLHRPLYSKTYRTIYSLIHLFQTGIFDRNCWEIGTVLWRSCRIMAQCFGRSCRIILHTCKCISRIHWTKKWIFAGSKCVAKMA